MPKQPEYVRIAGTLTAEIIAGDYDDSPLPGNADIASRFDVNLKTAGRAVQHLAASGLVQARPGMRAIAVPPEQRVTPWSMTGRYARARAAQDLVFASDIAGEVRKDTVDREWIAAGPLVAKFLKIEPETRVFRRRSRTYVDGVVAEDTAMHFPVHVVEAAPGIVQDETIQVVKLIEAAGHVVTRTANEIVARHPSPAEQGVFALAPNDVVIEHTHGTYGAGGEALEAVVNVRPAKGQVITFETYEAPVNEK
jgi:GntR family transcriptional regulator